LATPPADTIAPEASDTEIAQTSAPLPQTAPATADGARPVLSVKPTAQPVPGTRAFYAKKGQSRPLNEIVNLFAGKHISYVKVCDPFALADRTARAAQVSFLELLAKSSRSLDSVTIEFDPEVGDEPERDKVHDVRSKIAVAFSNGTAPKISFSPRRRGRRGDGDFHDREVAIDCVGAGGATQTHTLWTGRGLIALVDTNWDLRLTYQAPAILA
jgi:hypothetical protein